MRSTPGRARSRARGFTLIELIAVIVVLAILSGVAIPRYVSYRDRARQAADEASIAGINTALHHRYMSNRANGAAASSWITAASGVASVMDTGELPLGIRLNGTTFTDQRGNSYSFSAETQTSPARLAAAPGAPSGGGGSGGGSGGAADMPGVMLLVGAVPWMARPTRRDGRARR